MRPRDDRRFADAVAVIAGNHDRIARGIDAGDDADMAAAAAARHHRDRADLRSGNALAVIGERIRHVGAGAAIAGMLQHHVHEARAPQAATPGRVAAEVAARLSDDVRRGEGWTPSRLRAASGWNLGRCLRLVGSSRWCRQIRRTASWLPRVPSGTAGLHVDSGDARNASRDGRRDRPGHAALRRGRAALKLERRKRRWKPNTAPAR